jgi:hypothetical protein
MVDKNTFLLSVAISWILTLVTIVLIGNFAPNLLQPSSQNSSETLDDDLLIMQHEAMKPIINLGDYVRFDREISVEDVHASPKDSENPGDILVYQGTTSLQVARAIDKRIGEDGRITFLMHCDANWEGANEIVDEGRIVGKVVEIIPSSEK